MTLLFQKMNLLFMMITWNEVGVGGERMKYRKKPVIIEAYKYEGLDNFCKDANEGKLPEWAKEAHQKNIINFLWDISTDGDGCLIKTLEGDHLCSSGDYIIQGVKGELYPCKADVFEMTYEPVD